MSLIRHLIRHMRPVRDAEEATIANLAAAVDLARTKGHHDAADRIEPVLRDLEGLFGVQAERGLEIGGDRVVSRDRDVHGGDLVWSGTRVPVDTMIDHLRAGGTIAEYLAHYPTVDPSQVDDLLGALGRARPRSDHAPEAGT